MNDLVERLRGRKEARKVDGSVQRTWAATKLDIEAANRIEALEAALALALGYIVQFEPGDSRAVSNEFVAMAAVLADINNSRDQECLDIINAAINALKDK